MPRTTLFQFDSDRSTSRKEKGRAGLPLRLERLEDRITPYSTISKWPQPGGLGSPVTITYSYSNLLDGNMDLTSSQLKAAVQEALGRWAAVAPLTFVEVADSGPTPSDLNYDSTNRPMLRFGHHSMDGPWGVLAHGYFPSTTGLGGDIHFDVAERWTLHGSMSFDFLETATHEIGHALGLGHEPMPNNGGNTAIMNPYHHGWYSGLGTSFIFQDDINGIRANYGAGTGSVYELPTLVTVVNAAGTLFGLSDQHAVYRWSGSFWQRISGYNLDTLVEANGVVYALSKTERAVFQWTGSLWNRISGYNLDTLVEAADTVYTLSKSERAVFRWTGSVWARISGYNLDTLVVGGGVVSAHSASERAVFQWTGSVWSRISGYNMVNLNVFGDTLRSLADDGFVYQYVNGVWIRV